MTDDNQTSPRWQTVNRFAVVTGIVAAVHAAPALAYLDPGTGSIILQGLLAGLAAVMAAGSIFWHRIKTKFAWLFPRKKSPATESGQDSED